MGPSKGEIQHEKNKAQTLRKSSWWRQQIGPGICYHCGLKFASQELTMDHLVPLSQGGKSTKRNCVPSCKSCNTKKGYKTKTDLALEELRVSFENGGAQSELQISAEDSEKTN